MTARRRNLVLGLLCCVGGAAMAAMIPSSMRPMIPIGACSVAVLGAVVFFVRAFNARK